MITSVDRLSRLLTGQGTDKEYPPNMRVLPTNTVVLIAGLLLTGCGGSQDSISKVEQERIRDTESKVQTFIAAGCKSYARTGSVDGDGLVAFSKLAKLDPTYLEVAQAAFIASVFKDAKMNSDSQSKSRLDAIALIGGLCISFTTEEVNSSK